MNIALHGMETTLSEALTRQEGKPALVRYADDLVVFHLTQAGVRKAWQVVEQWLRGIGLELKPSKTRVAHTLTPLQGRTGFDLPLDDRSAICRRADPLGQKPARPPPWLQGPDQTQ
jgi:RNA-directed DNA polymerase